ncbi:DUF4233 domain-containing protein [Microbacterium sp.]|uniref:DUF4233 domain-containing protein n=1 Tax=Microbacterium sp. TaxID=51671 RepID=UPI00260804C7|nr:DUF4233 domain-containing protein [Microbacterium sp.]
MTSRATRTLVQKLASVVLGFEAVIVLLVGLTIFGLRALPEGVEPWWAIVGAGIVALAMVAVAGMITKPWAIPAGWALQAVVALSAIFEPTILLVVVVFGGMWAYATIMGARVDARRLTDKNSIETDHETHTESD